MWETKSSLLNDITLNHAYQWVQNYWKSMWLIWSKNYIVLKFFFFNFKAIIINCIMGTYIQTLFQWMSFPNRNNLVRWSVDRHHVRRLPCIVANNSFSEWSNWSWILSSWLQRTQPWSYLKVDLLGACSCCFSFVQFLSVRIALS